MLPLFCCPLNFLRILGVHALTLELDIFETPETATPQQEISESLKFFQNSLKILKVYFWGDSI